MTTTAPAGAQARRAGAWMVRPLARGCFALALAALPACYHYVPLESAPAPGVSVEVTLNDAGRVGMTNSVGSEVGAIQGIVKSRSDSGLVVSVQKVLGEYGGVSQWEGELVAIRPEYVRTIGERQFSATRTAMLAVVAGAGAIAFIASRNLLGLGGAPSPTGNGNGNTQ